MRDHTSDTTARIRRITLAPWDQMPVGMHHRLPCRIAAIQPEVETADFEAIGLPLINPWSLDGRSS